MPATSQQIENRDKRVGASDVAALLGLDPYKTAHDVWLEKTRRVDGQPVNQAMEAGLRFEEGVLVWAQRRLGKTLKRNQYRTNPGLYLGTHLDALDDDENAPVEAKTAGLFGPLREDWGDDGTDQVPDRVIVQDHAQMLCVGTGTEAQVCHNPAFLGGRGFVLYHVPRNDELTKLIGEATVAFWEKNVLRDMPPAGVHASLGTLKRIRRTPNKVVPVSLSLLQDYERLTTESKEAKARVDAAKAAILEGMMDAEAGDFGDGRWASYYEETRRAYDVAESSRRVFRLRKGTPQQ